MDPGTYRFTIKPLRDPKIPIPLTKLKRSNTHTSCSDGSDKYFRSRSSRGQDSSLFGKLATNNYRSKCPTDSKTVSDRICKSANTINTHGQPKVRGGRVTKHRHRGTSHARKGSYRKGAPHCGAICGTRFLTTQEKRNIQIGIQSETTEPIYSDQTLQNGKYDHAGDHDTASGLDDDNRLMRRVSLSSNALGSSKVSEVHVEGTTVPVHLRPIWIEPSPKGVYKTAQTGHGDSKKVRSENSHFSGRYYYFKSEQRCSNPGFHNLAATAPRVHNKLGEILSKPIPESGVFRFDDTHKQ